MDNNENINVVVEAAEETAKLNWKKEALDWFVSIAVAVILALIIRNFVFTIAKVDGESMHPTLTHGDRLFTRIIGYNNPKAGDIIIFNPSISENMREPNKKVAYVKRVIAVAGQEVDITRDGRVSVDGEILEEDYISEPIRVVVPNGTEFPFTVPEDTVFVMGDNRNRSHDSRSRDVGAVPLDNIIGKAQIRLWPLNKLGTLYK